MRGLSKSFVSPLHNTDRLNLCNAAAWWFIGIYNGILAAVFAYDAKAKHTLANGRPISLFENSSITVIAYAGLRNVKP